MPGFLETGFGSLLGVGEEGGLFEMQSRQLPKQVQEIERISRIRKLTVIEEALLEVAKEVFNPSSLSGVINSFVTPQREINARVAMALRSTAIAAFVPRTTVSYLENNESTNSSTWADLAEMAQEIVVPAPARLHVLMTLDVNCKVASAQTFEARVECVGMSTSYIAHSRFRSPSANGRGSVVSQELMDLSPEIAYTMTPQIRISSTGLATYNVNGFGSFDGWSSLMCRVEARSLATRG